MEVKKQVWRMKDVCLVNQKVDFGEPVTMKQAIEMWLNEEYADILDSDVDEILEFREAQ